MGKIIVFRVAWMKKYNGITKNDVPEGGGEYVDQNQSGSEIYNFSPCQGSMYGFVEPGYLPKPKRINIGRLGASKTSSKVSEILVVWVARNPCTFKTVVVGWYKNATIHKARQSPPSSCERLQPSGNQARYFAEANAEDCKLLPVDERNLEVPTGKGGIGENNLWYMEGCKGKGFKKDLDVFLKPYCIG